MYTFEAGSLGLGLVDQSGRVVVNQAYPNTQAHGHGILPGGVVSAINNKSVVGMGRDDVIKAIQAAPRPMRLQIIPAASSNASSGRSSGRSSKGDDDATRAARRAPSGAQPEPARAKWATEMVTLREMGFTDEAKMRKALDETNGDVDAALNRLF